MSESTKREREPTAKPQANRQAEDRANEPAAAAEISRVTQDILPALISRLANSELGELEVAERGWRVRLRRGIGAAVPIQREPQPIGARSHLHASGAASGGSAQSGPAAAAAALSAGSAARGSVLRRAAVSPAVGYFTPRKGLAAGQAVRSGDALGSVDVLGVAQAVIAPSDGIVGRVLAATGEAVEYGQELVRIDGIERLVES